MNHSHLPLLISALILWAAAATHAGGLTETERRLADVIEERQPEALALLEEAVQINSGTMNPAGVRRVGDLFADALADLGLMVGWVDGADFDRAGHLVARHGGNGPHLLLIGHLDTVFEPDSPFQDFERLGPDRARGPGIVDMKGGNVIIVQALAALKALDVLDELRITVVLTGDEESSGRPLSLARRALLEAADAADVALGFEDGDGNPQTAVIARRGYTDWTLTTAGTPAHSSLIFRDEVGAGAVFEAARILDAFRSQLAGEQHLTFNPGLMLAGTQLTHDSEQTRGEAFGKSNVVAERAVVSGDLRTLSQAQLASATTRMQEIVSVHLPGTSAQIRFDDGYPPLAPTDGNRQLLSMYDRVSRDLGLGQVTAVDPSAAGAADISFTSGRVEMALDGLGLMGTGGHTVEETADLSTLASQAKRAAVLMYRLRDWQPAGN